MNKPTEPKKEIYTSRHFRVYGDYVLDILNVIDDIKKEYPFISNQEISFSKDKYDEDYYLIVNVWQHNPYYEMQMMRYNRELKLYEEELLAKEIKKQSKIDKKLYSDKRREERIANQKIEAEETSEVKTIFVDNKKYEVKLVGEFNVKSN